MPTLDTLTLFFLDGIRQAALIELFERMGWPVDVFANSLDRAADEAWMAARLGKPLPSMRAVPAEALRSEAELLDPVPATRDWLAQQTGQSAAALRAADGAGLGAAMAQLWRSLGDALPKGAGGKGAPAARRAGPGPR